jgi:hypothetical protein
MLHPPDDWEEEIINSRPSSNIPTQRSPQLRHTRRRNEDRTIHGVPEEMGPGVDLVDIYHDAWAEENGVVGGFVECECCAEWVLAGLSGLPDVGWEART